MIGHTAHRVAHFPLAMSFATNLLLSGLLLSGAGEF